MQNVRDFGAVGDGVHKDTAAIQKAIDAGGTVYFPSGTYLSGTIYLKSGTGLELDPGAVLLASPDPEDYNADDYCLQNIVFTSEHVSGAHFISAVEQHNIMIRGGRIDGNRQAFFGGKTEVDNPGKFVIKGWRPGQMIYLCECENVTLENVELYNAPYWTCFLHGCEQVNIHAIRIYNDSHTHNGDGIDLDCCRFVTVSDCIIDSGDDCITLRGNSGPLKKKRPCEYITVSNCILSTNCNGLRIGVGDGIVPVSAISAILSFTIRAMPFALFPTTAEKKLFRLRTLCSTGFVWSPKKRWSSNRPTAARIPDSPANRSAGFPSAIYTGVLRKAPVLPECRIARWKIFSFPAFT